MQLHEIRSTLKRKKKKRIGRGGKKGTYSGRGIKGQKARAGTRMQPVVRELLKRYPKQRGYRFAGKKKTVAAINLKDLEKHFEARGVVSPKTLVHKNILSRLEAKRVKILAGGEVTKELVVEGCAVSASARKKIEEAGGTIKYVVSKSHSDFQN